MVEIISIVILILYALGLLVFVALFLLDRFRSLKEMKAVLLCTFCWPNDIDPKKIAFDHYEIMQKAIQKLAQDLRFEQ